MTKCMCKTVAASALSAAGLMGLSGCAATASPSGSMAVATERADCPGKIVCAITGELICADRCPAESGMAVASGTSSCCAVAPRQ